MNVFFGWAESAHQVNGIAARGSGKVPSENFFTGFNEVRRENLLKSKLFFGRITDATSRYNSLVSS
jgi:hypothetical protein